MGERDLVAALRQLDAELVERSPNPRLQARLQASLRARGGSRGWPPGGLGWSLGLAGATAAVLLGTMAPRAGAGRTVASGDPTEISREKIRADAGLSDPTSRGAVLPSIHAPLLREPPTIHDRTDAPPVPERRPAPPDGERPRSREGDVILPEDAPAPATRPRTEAPRFPPAGASAGGAAQLARGSSRPLVGSPLPGSTRSSVAAPAFLPVPPEVAPAPPPIAVVPPPDPAPCETPDALKLEADARCAAEGMVPSTYDFLEACGDGTYRSVDPKCIPPPDMSSASCRDGVVGDGTTCTDPALLDKQAEELCSNAGLSLLYFAPDGAGCGWQASLAKYVCCPAPLPAPPSPAPACFSGEIDVATCNTHDALAARALELCATKNTSVTDLSFAHACPGGGALTVIFTCCAP